MSGLNESNVIDLVAQDAAGKTLLVLVVDSNLNHSTEFHPKLMEKLNTYAGFATDGSLVDKYPETQGRDIIIQVNVDEPVIGPARELLTRASTSLRDFGIALRVNVRGRGSVEL